MATAEVISLPKIRLNDRIAIFGRTGTGKSILAHSMFKSIPVPQTEAQAEHKPFWRIIVDVTDSVYDDALEFYNPAQIPWGEAFSLRFVPDAVNLEESINILYMNMMAHGDVWIWCDEANELSTAHKTIYGMRKILLQGRKFQIGHCSVTPRPRDISRSIITQSEHFFIFPLTDPEDRARVANNVNMNKDEFDIRMANLVDYGYLWYSVRDDVIFEMPPLPLEEVMRLE